MNPKERGFLLLTGQLGDPERKPLTVAQFRTLARRVIQMEQPKISRELMQEDLVSLGYDRSMANRIINLLGADQLLDRYINRGHLRDCFPITRVTEDYPLSLRKRLGLDAPGCLWAKGDISLLNRQTVALVGSRELAEPNRVFAQRVGTDAAKQGFVLVSGNARGADRVAQDACLENGGKVICVVADELQKYPVVPNVLYLSEDSFDLPFTSQRALSRNRIIHSLGYITFVAQCKGKRGGTWDGTVKNLRNGWSSVFCFADGSEISVELEQLGATLTDLQEWSTFSELQHNRISLF